MQHSKTPHSFLSGTFVLIGLVLLCLTAPAARACPTALGPGTRIFITNCHPGDLAASDFRQLADAGFTLVMRPTDIFYPDKNKSSLEATPAYFRLAAAAGLDAGVFQGGLIVAEGRGEPRSGQDGKVGPYLPCDSPLYWQILGGTILDWAKISVKDRNFKCVALDFEHYLGGTGDFGESYDAVTMGEFYRSIGKQLPDPLPAPEKRIEFMKTEGLNEKFLAFQRDRVLAQVKKLRAKIDEINPCFQIGIYGWGRFLEAALEGFATNPAPVLDCNPSTYGRGAWDPAYDADPEGGYKGVMNRPDRLGLKWSAGLVAAGCRRTRERTFPSVYLAGHWPQVSGPDDGSQYKFSARQAFDSTAYGQGYWIWTEPLVRKPWTSIPDWIKATLAYFGEANAALDSGDYTWSSRQPDSIADPKATKPLNIVTFAGGSASVWNPVTGERTGKAKRPAPQPAAAEYKGNPIRINGSQAELVDAKTGEVRMTFPDIHGVRALAVGDVDGIQGDELVTLNAGWVRIWDPESGAELLRFRVGSDQTAIALEPLK